MGWRNSVPAARRFHRIAEAGQRPGPDRSSADGCAGREPGPNASSSSLPGANRRPPPRLERLVRILRRDRFGDRLLLDLLLEILDRRLELRVLALERRVRQVVDDDVGIDAVAFDQPVALRAEDAGFGGGRDAAVDQEVVRPTARSRRPRCACRSPCRGRGDGSLRRTPRRPTPCTRRPARPCGRGRRTACSRSARRPAAASRTTPCAAASRGPAVDVAAVVVAHVDDQPLAIEHRVELALPLGHVAAAHRAQVHVADPVVGQLLDRQPPRVFPLVVAKVVLAPPSRSA